MTVHGAIAGTTAAMPAHGSVYFVYFFTGSSVSTVIAPLAFSTVN